MTRRSAPGLGCLVLGLLILGGMSISFFANGQWVSGIMFGVGTIVVAASVIARVVLGAAQIRRFSADASRPACNAPRAGGRFRGFLGPGYAPLVLRRRA
jgi:hypothetical protein